MIKAEGVLSNYVGIAAEYMRGVFLRGVGLQDVLLEGLLDVVNAFEAWPGKR
jgi:hypothetical protein